MKKFIAIILMLVVMCSSFCVVGYADYKDSYYAFDDELKTYTQELCEEYEVPYSLVIAIMYHESRFKPDVGTKYVGLMQVGTTKDINAFLKNQNEEAFGHVYNLYDPKTNILAGVTILKKDIESSKTLEEAMCKYACGEANYAKRMRMGSGYCKPSREIIEIMHEYEDIIEYDFLKNKLEHEKEHYHELMRESEIHGESFNEFYEFAISNSFEVINFLTNEIAKYEMEDYNG